MNKKKSKALSFLLAASLLVPSTNGIVSAAEVDDSNVAIEESISKEESYTVVKTEDELRKALQEKKKKIVIYSDIELKSSIPIDVDGVEIRGSIKVENGISKNQTTIKGGGMFNINANNVVIEHLNFENTKEGSVGFVIGNNITSTIRMCEFTGAPIFNLIISNQTSSIKFIKNKVNMNARALMVGVSNGSEISNNEIDLKNEHYGSNGRSGAISLTAQESQNGDITITENTFKNVNRVIGVDHSNIDGKRIKIKDNKFIESRFALEVGTNSNKGNNYDLSNNYFTHKDVGGVGALKIEDADSKEIDHFTYGDKGTEIKLNDSTPVDIIVGPYYSSENDIGSTNISHAGVASVNGKDYPTLEKAIKAAKEESDKTVKLVSDIEVDTWKQIDNIKGITIDGTKSENEKYTIKVTNKIDSNQNDDAVLHSAGENTFKNLTIDLSGLKEGSKQQGVRAISASEGDKIENLTIKGNGFVSYGIVVDKQCKNLKVKGSNISNCKYGIYFATEDNNVGENIRIDGNKFNNCEFASILYPEKVEFCNNELENSKLNIMTDTTQVINNNIKGNSKIKFYTHIDFRYNSIENAKDSIEFLGENIIENMFMERNYWGSAEPNFDEIVIGNNKLTPEQLEKFEPYYTENCYGNQDVPLKGETYSVDVKIKGEGTIKGANSAKEGKKVKIELEPEKGWYLASIESKDVKLTKESNYVYTFIMPKKEVTLDIVFKKESSYIPSKPSKPIYTHEEIIGLDRYETAGKVADKLGSYNTVVLVNATSTMSDGLSASGLAGKENGAILLVKKDSIPKVTMDRIKKVKKVYIIGGENAISEKVAKEIAAANIKVERLGGKTRVETSELVAQKLGNYNKAFIVNGFKGEADAMSVSAVAARNKAPILLTNGKSSNHTKKSRIEYYVIGGNSVVDKSIVSKYNAKRLAGENRYETNKKVINEFYSGSDKIYLANGDKLVDALTASPLAKNNGIVLVNKKSDKSILKGKDTVQVGGMNFQIKFEK
ncbi:cell wall-binding repeat-containing protein [Peptacetobacter sp.]|uniref:cell wall-binding repeat-containing protein n=1 Tax=Peptacetobacter sp. TaxID=2991975 RepID=UPI00262C441F|nr:cell wall-binding repeat-containing protein [Peptacetobacter sp.]